MLSVVIRMAFYCIVFQRFGRRGWPSSGNVYLSLEDQGNLNVLSINNKEKKKHVIL